MINIVMIEDDSEYAQLLSKFLAKYNIKVTNYEDPFVGSSVDFSRYDLLILDLTLPGLDGLDICKEIAKKYDIPIIISSARGDISDKVIGLELGADDYLPKPYDPNELYARILSLLRRYKKINTKEDNRFVLDETKEELLINGKKVKLTVAEYEILLQLYKSLNSTVSKEQILYSSTIFANSNENSLAVIINRLRKKLQDVAQIKTVRGIGYKLLI